MARTCLVRSFSSLTMCASSLSIAWRCSGMVTRGRMTNDQRSKESEILPQGGTKSERNPNDQIPNQRSQEAGGSPSDFEFRTSGFFRISDLGFRILPCGLRHSGFVIDSDFVPPCGRI